MRQGLIRLSLLFWSGLWAFPALADSPSFDYALYAHVLQKHVSEEGQVHYRRLQAERADLDAFVAQIGRLSPESSPETFPTRETQLAYWINSYNALVLQKVIDHYPVGSIRDISFLYGFFWKLKFLVGGRQYTLDQIEHGIIRWRFRDPRIHFAINCASASCPKLQREPFLPQTLDQQLDEAARFFVSESRNVRLDPEKKRIHLSMIFNWYLGDFRNYLRDALGQQNPSVLDYIQLYASSELKSFIASHKPSLRYIPYDWSLNDAGSATQEAGSR